MASSITQDIKVELERIDQEGLSKNERIIDTPQQAWIEASGARVLNFCANNYLGLADHPAILKAAKEGIDRWGYGMASVRFICGTQSIHKELEAAIADFVGTEDSVLYSSCFDANGGLFETLLTDKDAIISDELNHASIIDGIRLCKARRFVYKNCDMADLEARLKEASSCRYRLVATDGVFSMDGTVAPLDEIRRLADRYDALLMVDDSHAVGFFGPQGRGSHDHRGIFGRVDIITGTLGKALGGASGGYTAANRTITSMLRQRSRPYLFSNTLAPPIVAASLATLSLISRDESFRLRLAENTRYFRKRLSEAGFSIAPGEHPIVPIMLGEARVAREMADRMLARGVYVIGFSYPVVPKGKARIRTQVSAAHTREDLDLAVEQFAAVKKEMGLA